MLFSSFKFVLIICVLYLIDMCDKADFPIHPDST